MGERHNASAPGHLPRARRSSPARANAASASIPSPGTRRCAPGCCSITARSDQGALRAGAWGRGRRPSCCSARRTIPGSPARCDDPGRMSRPRAAQLLADAAERQRRDRWFYAPFVLNRYTQATASAVTKAGQATIYWIVSTWNPYNVVVSAIHARGYGLATSPTLCAPVEQIEDDPIDRRLSRLRHGACRGLRIAVQHRNGA